jgi:hypothetical protein
VWLAGPVGVELAVLGTAHAALIVRIVAARHVSKRQRAADAARFQQMRDLPR